MWTRDSGRVTGLLFDQTEKSFITPALNRGSPLKIVWNIINMLMVNGMDLYCWLNTVTRLHFQWIAKRSICKAGEKVAFGKATAQKTDGANLNSIFWLNVK